MRHEHHRYAERPEPSAQLGAQRAAGGEVERRERLVQQQELRLPRQRASERDALLLSSRKLRGPAPLEPLETEGPEQLV